GSVSIQHTDSAGPYVTSRFYRAEQLSGSDSVAGDHLVTNDGDIILHPINHGTLVMQWRTHMIYVDPTGGTTPYRSLPRAHVVLLTHGHGDHFDQNTINGIKDTTAVILAPRAVQQVMTVTLRNITTVMTNGASTNVLGIGIEAVPAYNLTTSNHPKGVGNGYVLTIGGKRIYIAGDTEDIPEMRALRDIDAAFVCMNLPYTMSVDKAASAVRQFRPKVVYPYHYSGSDVNRFKRLVGTDLGIEVRLRKWY
ncbi:MAG: MBL fold metallo-hydrolase, partial [Verrucomicrobiota bacterium]